VAMRRWWGNFDHLQAQGFVGPECEMRLLVSNGREGEDEGGKARHGFGVHATGAGNRPTELGSGNGRRLVWWPGLFLCIPQLHRLFGHFSLDCLISLKNCMGL